MKLIQPFPGWRPKPELVEQISAPPYDVLNRQEAKELAKDNPNSFLHVSKAEIDLPDDVSPYDEQVYEAAKKQYKSLQKRGLLKQDPAPYLYFYRLIMDGREQLGLVAAASVPAYNENRIKKHEFTRPAKEDDRTKISEALGAHSGPVFLTYRHSKTVDKIAANCVATQTPVYDFTANDGIRHTIWVVSDKTTIDNLVDAFEALPGLYIADGHHRSAAASRVAAMREKQGKTQSKDAESSSNRFLSVIFPDNQMRILDYNRVVTDLNGLSEEEFLAEIAKQFTITQSPTPFKPSQPNSFGMYLKNKWYQLKLSADKIDKNDPVTCLDVSLLNQYLLDPILGIKDPRRDPRIDFVGGIRGLQGLEARVDSKEMTVAFSMYPTALSELMSVADANQVMPPKSTWFEPKLRDGLVIQEI
ncbi:MAG: DUF1015 domain-containing protein [Magnetococcales bacterium]|nr:DUF1015 domain-containing protein [Magnetococcales bacterium]